MHLVSALVSVVLAVDVSVVKCAVVCIAVSFVVCVVVCVAGEVNVEAANEVDKVHTLEPSLLLPELQDDGSNPFQISGFSGKIGIEFPLMGRWNDSCFKRLGMVVILLLDETPVRSSISGRLKRYATRPAT